MDLWIKGLDWIGLNWIRTLAVDIAMYSLCSRFVSSVHSRIRSRARAVYRTVIGPSGRCCA